jgi:hypothetical protein
MSANDTIYLAVRAGFANRLRALISGICLAEDLGKKLVVIWDKEPSCGNSANIFEKGSFPSFLTFQNIPTKGFKYIEHLTDINPNDTQFVSYAEFHRSDPIRWTAHLRNVKFKVKSPICNTIGVHIRRTDNAASIRLSPLEYFIEYMKKESEAIFYLSTDCEKTKAIVLDIFGANIITNNFCLYRDTEEGMINAIYDFVSLSQCIKIIGSNASSFSELAARYGNVELLLNS